MSNEKEFDAARYQHLLSTQSSLVHPELMGKTLKGMWSVELGIVFLTFDDGTTVKIIGFVTSVEKGLDG